MYYKILKKNMNHNDFQYHEGLNVDTNEFNPTPNYDGGLFFSDAEHIMLFCDYGDLLAEVEIPEGEKIVQVYDKYKSHSIILKNIKPLWNVDTFKWMTEQGNDIHADNDFALQCAAGNGHLEVAKYLLENGANINANGDYPLRWAAENGHIEVVKYLVENGADIHANDDWALRYAAENGHIEVVKYLVEHGALRWAASNGHREIVSYLESIIESERLQKQH